MHAAHQIRFIVKHVPLALRKDNWRIYDTITGSFPYYRKDIGQVRQDRPKAEAEAEANRLNTTTGGSP